MKVLKVVGVVVAAVALVATGIGLAIGGAVATAGAAAGSATFLGIAGTTWATIGAVAGVVGGVIGLAGAALASKPGFSTSGNPQQFQTNPQSGLPYCFGRTSFAGLRVYGTTTRKPDWTKFDDMLCFAVLLSAGGAIEAAPAFSADTVAVTFDGTGEAVGAFQNYMAQKVSTGQSGAAALSLSLEGAVLPGWGASYKLGGMAHALWMLRYDSNGEFYTAGAPQPRWVGKWVKVYDPRLDSTYPGGSGSCRALDETTYVWSRNPALHGLTWCLGRWQNGKRILGIGAPVAAIRVADFVEAANVADANAWACGGTAWSTDHKWSVLKSMLQAGGAEPTKTGAMIGCRVNTPRVSIATIAASDLLDSLSISVTQSRRVRLNTRLPRYRSESHDWEVITGSAVQVSAYVTADGGERARELDLPFVQAEVGQAGFNGNLQAGQLTAYEIVNAREGGPIVFTTGPKWLGLKSGDCVTLDVPEEGLSATKVILTSDPVFDPASGKCSFTADTETDSKHAFALGTSTTPPPAFAPTVPDLVPPQPGAGVWTLAAAAGADGLPYLTISGGVSDPSWDALLVSYREVGAVSWTFFGSFVDRGDLSIVIPGVDGATNYEAQVAYATSAAIGPWRTLSSVTTPENELQTLIAEALETVATKRTVFWGPTPPSHLDSIDPDLWINSSDGNRLYRRVPGTGRLAIGSSTITLGGNYIVLAWTMADDQRIAQALLAAAGAQATADQKVRIFYMHAESDPVPVGDNIGDLLIREYADPIEIDHWSGLAWQSAATYGATTAQIEATEAAQADADVALADLANIASDGVLTPDEKPRVILDRDTIVNEQSGIDAQATAFGVTTEKTAYDNAVSALTTYLATLTAPVLWSNLTGITTITGTTFRTKFADVYGARQVLLNKLTEIAKARGDQGVSDASAAAANAASALGKIADIVSDSILDRSEKPSVVAQRTAIVDEQGVIDARATAFGITTEKSTYDAAVSALTSYLGGLTPAWNDYTQDTGIVRATFNGKFTDVYYARQVLLDKIAEVAKARGDLGVSDAAAAAAAADNFVVNGPLAGGSYPWSPDAGIARIVPGPSLGVGAYLEFQPGAERKAWANAHGQIPLNGAAKLFVSAKGYRDVSTPVGGQLVAVIDFYENDGDYISNYVLNIMPGASGTFVAASGQTAVPALATSFTARLQSNVTTNIAAGTDLRVARMQQGADITGENTASNTANVGGTAAGTVEGGANAANNGVNSDGTIKNDKVTTPAIVDNSVTNPVSAYTPGEINVDFEVEASVQSLTITATGKPIIVSMNLGIKANNEYPQQAVGYVRLYRGATQLLEIPFFTGDIFREFPSFSIIDTPSAGSVTYYIKVYPTTLTTISPPMTYGGSGALISQRSLYSVEAKK